MRYLAKCTCDAKFGDRRSATFAPTNTKIVENEIMLIYNSDEKRFEVGEIYVIEVKDKPPVEEFEIGDPVG
jgi:hypothetical protein